MYRYSAPILASSLLALAVGVYIVSADATLSAATPKAVRVQYGTPQKVGNGTVRTYVMVDGENDRVPLEVGVALSESAMEGLPAAVPMSHEQMMAEEAKSGGHANMHTWILDLPATNPSPYKFVQFGWNPVGHQPATVYDLPHFDFHFWTASAEMMNSIMPSDPQYAEKAAKLPPEAQRPTFYLDPMTIAKAPAAAVAVPKMGIHWLDVRSPELQGLAGHPENAKPFTKTFIYGSWDGQFVFDEPMITRAHIVAKRDAGAAWVRDELIPVPTAAKHAAPGFYPSAYRIMYDAKTKEYRVAMTQLVWRD
jgi:hypothetical protein